jgi:hypothetical protein
VALAALGCFLSLGVSTAVAGSASAVTRDGNRETLQRLHVRPGVIHHFVKVTDPDGFEPYCVTTVVERRRAIGWEPLSGKSPRTRREQCFPSTAASTVSWDSFVYPNVATYRALKRGKLRVVGSIDLGARLVVRL